MSGFAGVFNTDGEPVDPALMARMADALIFRGPDGRGLHTDGAIGLVHTLLREDPGPSSQAQPCSLGGTLWGVFDARLDARDDLITALASCGRTGLTTATDPQLILHAFAQWQEACLDRLFGDYAFAIWDGNQRALFCARDQMGVKPFFYARVGRAFVFSNTLNCVRLHPAVTTRLDDLAIADFLMFGFPMDTDNSVFADIRRLPAGHFTKVSGGGFVINRYWELPIEEPIYYRRKADYADQFKQLLTTAVSERLPANPVGVFMSGGLDSPALAATACAVQRRRGRSDGVRAFTMLHEHNKPDPERHYAGLVAKHLGIPIDFRVISAEPFEELPAGIVLASPAASPFEVAAERRYYAGVARFSRTVLYGEGPDNALLYEWQAYLGYLRGKRAWTRMAFELVLHAVAHRRLPLISTVPAMLRQRFVRPWWNDQFPVWLNESLVSSLKLRERWACEIDSLPAAAHPIRPKAFNNLRSVNWPTLFEQCDAETTGAPIQFRHPFIDLRLLRFMLRVPVLPWCRRKYLLRFAMCGQLPKTVLTRPKTPLEGAPTVSKARGSGLVSINASDVACRFATLASAKLTAQDDFSSTLAKLRVVGLNRWMNTHIPAST